MLLKKSKLINAFKKFADGTTLHGYKDFYYTKSKIMKIFWLIVLTATLCSTIFHIYKTVIHYHNQPTVITFESVKSGEMIYPDLMLCYPHWMYWVSWRKVTALDFTKETALYGLSFLSEIYYSSSPINVAATKCKFEQQMSKNNFTKLTQFYHAIAQTRPPRTLNLQKHFSKFSLKFLPSPDHRICYVMSGDQISTILKTDIFGWGIWFHLNHSTWFGYSKFVESDEYRAYLRSFLFKADSLLKLKNDLNHQTQNQLDFYHLPVHLQINENHLDSIAISPDVEQYVIKVSATVRKWKNKNSNPCTEGTIQNGFFDRKCQLKCLADAMFSCKGKCMEFEHAFLIDNDHPNTVCTKPIKFLRNATSSKNQFLITSDTDFNKSITANDSCKENRVVPLAKGICKELLSFKPESCRKCIQSCEQWDFERSATITQQPKSVRDIAVQEYTKIFVLYPRAESIIVMTEIDSLTYDGMIADVGGLLGIWLGASVVTFVQIIYHCCFDNSDTDDNSIPAQ